MAKFPCTQQDGTPETKTTRLLKYSHWIQGLLACTEACLMDYIKGLLCVLNKLQDQTACQMTNIGLQLLDLAKFRAYWERLLLNGNSAPGTLRALAHMQQRINIGWLRWFLPAAVCSGRPMGLPSYGMEPPPARGQLLPQSTLRWAELWAGLLLVNLQWWCGIGASVAGEVLGQDGLLALGFRYLISIYALAIARPM